MAVVESKINFLLRVGLCDGTHFRRSKSVCKPNFADMSRSIAEILLLPVGLYENKWPPYLNSTSGFDFDLRTVIGMSFCVSLPNFIEIEPPTAELWHHIDCSRWRPSNRKSISVSRFSEGTTLTRWKSICKPNFDEISQATAWILHWAYYFGFHGTNRRHIGILLPILTLSLSSSACPSALADQIPSESGDRQQS